MGRADFSDQFRKIIIRHKRIGYDLNVKRQSACLVINPITVNNFAALFNCTPVNRVLDSLWSLLAVLVSKFRRCFTLCLFIILLVQFGLLSGHLLGNSCPLG